MWIVAVALSSLAFSASDVLCDVCIDGSGEEQVNLEGRPLPQPSSPNDTELKVTENDETHLSGEQDTIIAVAVTSVVVWITAIYRLQTVVSVMPSPKKLYLEEGSIPTDDISIFLAPISPVWRPSLDFEFWVAAVAGVMLLASYICTIKAYETTNSTVVLPLRLLVSCWVFFGSFVNASILDQKWIRLEHIPVYIGLFIGGFLPASNGDMWCVFTAKFWKKPYVRFTIAAEVASGCYDLALSLCSHRLGGENQEAVGSEFFFISRIFFVAASFAILALAPSVRLELWDLRNVSVKYVLLSIVGEALCVLGFYIASFAYAAYYQASIVHTAEMSMNQIFNLILCYTLKVFFDIGRDTAVQSLRYKLISFVLVFLSLLFLSMMDAAV